MPAGQDVRAALCAALAIFFFALVDLGAKWFGTRHNVIEIMFFRSLFGLPPVLLFAMQSGGNCDGLRGFRGLVKRLAPAEMPFLLAIGALTSVYLLCLFFALPLASIAEVYSVTYAAPLCIAVMGLVWLAEKATFMQWCALIGGFAGVLFVLRPSGNIFHMGGLAALAGTLCYSLAMVLVRYRGSRIESAVIASCVMASGVVITAPFMLFVEVWPDFDAWMMLIVVGLCAGLGQICVTTAFRTGRLIIVAPMQYTSIIWAIMFGYIFFDTPLDMVHMAGVAVVIGCGLYITVSAVSHGRSAPQEESGGDST